MFATCQLGGRPISPWLIRTIVHQMPRMVTVVGVASLLYRSYFWTWFEMKDRQVDDGDAMTVDMELLMLLTSAGYNATAVHNATLYHNATSLMNEAHHEWSGVALTTRAITFVLAAITFLFRLLCEAFAVLDVVYRTANWISWNRELRMVYRQTLTHRKQWQRLERSSDLGEVMQLTRELPSDPATVMRMCQRVSELMATNPTSGADVKEYVRDGFIRFIVVWAIEKTTCRSPYARRASRLRLQRRCGYAVVVNDPDEPIEERNTSALKTTTMAMARRAFPYVFVEEEDVLEHACRALASMCICEAIRKSIIEETGVSFLIHTLDDWMENVRVVESMCEALCCMLHHKDVNRSIVDADGVHLFLRVVHEHASNARVVQHASTILATIAWNNADNRSKVVEAGGIETWLCMLRTHFADAGIVQRVCFALNAVCYDVSRSEKVVEAGGVEVLLKVMHAHIANAYIVQHVFWVLGLISASEELQATIVEAGGVEALLRAMRKLASRSSEVVEQALIGLFSISQRSESCREKLATVRGGIAEIVRAMRKHRSNARVGEIACGLLSNVAAYCKGNKRVGRARVVAAGGIEALVRAMRDFGSHARLLMHACTALWTISYKEKGFQAKIAAADGGKVLMQAVHDWAEVVDVVEPACGALANVTIACSQKQCEDIAAGGGVEVLIKLIGEHSAKVAAVVGATATTAVSASSTASAESADIVCNACRTLGNIAVTTQIRNRIVELGGTGLAALLGGIKSHPMHSRSQDKTILSVFNLWNVVEGEAHARARAQPQQQQQQQQLCAHCHRHCAAVKTAVVEQMRSNVTGEYGRRIEMFKCVKVVREWREHERA